MSNELTTEDFWSNYWTNEKIDFLTKRKPYFSELIDKQFNNKSVSTRFIEIGGFPGIYCFYVKKKYDCKTTLLDYYIDKKIIKQVARAFKIKVSKLEIKKVDLFTYNTKEKYDIVFSSGFIEHFENPYAVIKKHIDLLDKNGMLLITLPNFLGLNGYLQKKIDNQLYLKHNIDTMNIIKLNKIMSKFKLSSYDIYYYGGSGVFFENLKDRSIFLRFLVYFFYLLKFPLKVLKINTKLLAPHIIIEAVK